MARTLGGLAVAGLLVFHGSALSAATFGTLKQTFSYTITRMILDAPRHRIYATDAPNNRVIVFNTDTSTVNTTIAVGSSPYGLALSPDGTILYVANSGSTTKAFSIIDPVSLTVTGTVAADNAPSDVVVGLGGRLYATTGDYNNHAIMQIDPANAANNTTFGSVYSGVLVLSPDGKTLYVGDRGLSPSTLSKYDVSTATASLIQKSDFNKVGQNGEELAINHAGTELLYSNGSGQSNYNTAAIPTSNLNGGDGTFVIGAYPRCGTFSFDDAVAYLGQTGSSGVVRAYDAAQFTVLGTLTLPEDFSYYTAPILVDQSNLSLYVATASHVYVYDTGRLPFITNGPVSTAKEGVSYTFQITADATASSYGATGLPDGLTVNSSTGVISGIATVAGSYAVTLSATSSVGTTNQALALTVRAPLTVSVTGSGTVDAAFVGTTYHRLMEDISIQATPGTEQRFVSWSGDLQSTANPLTFAMTDGVTLQANFLPIAPVITSNLSVSVPVNSQLSYQIVAAHQPTSYSASALPDGFSFNAETGVLSGSSSVAGNYSATITATNGGGSDNETLQIIVTTPLQITLAGQGTITSGFDGTSFRQIGATYNLTATAAKGYVFTGWTGSVLEADAALSFVMEQGFTLQGNFLARSDLAGKFAGLAAPAGSPYASTELVTLTIDEKGKFLGTAKLQGKQSTFSGKFADDGSATVKVKHGTLSLQTTQIYGDLEVVGSALIDGTSVPIRIPFSPFNAKLPTTLAGHYQVNLPATNPSDTTVPPTAIVNLSIAKSGLVQLDGKLGDGSKVTFSTRLAGSETFAVYIPLYGGRGLLSGVMSFDAGANVFTGTLTWFKPNDAAPPYQKIYPLGFTTQIEATATAD